MCDTCARILQVSTLSAKYLVSFRSIMVEAVALFFFTHPSPFGQDQEQPKTPTTCVEKTGRSRFAPLLCQCALSFIGHT